MAIFHSSLAECLCAVAQFYQCGAGKACNPSVKWAGLLNEAKASGLVGEYQQFNAANIEDYSLPAIAYAGNGRGFVLAAVKDGTALIHHPASGRSESLPLSQLAECWSGEFVILRPASAKIGELRRFDFTWFIPALVVQISFMPWRDRIWNFRKKSSWLGEGYITKLVKYSTGFGYERSAW